MLVFIVSLSHTHSSYADCSSSEDESDEDDDSNGAAEGRGGAAGGGGGAVGNRFSDLDTWWRSLAAAVAITGPSYPFQKKRQHQESKL